MRKPEEIPATIQKLFKALPLVWTLSWLTEMSVVQQKNGSHKSSIIKSSPNVSLKVQLKYDPVNRDTCG